MTKRAMRIENPLVLMFQAKDGTTITRLHPPADMTHEHYGLLVCDLVRHVAMAFRVPEASVWRWVDIERANPSTDIHERN